MHILSVGLLVIAFLIILSVCIELIEKSKILSQYPLIALMCLYAIACSLRLLLKNYLENTEIDSCKNPVGDAGVRWMRLS